MGASTSKNLSTILSSVSTDISNTTQVSQKADSTCNQKQSLSGCTIKSSGKVEIMNTCNLTNVVDQMGSVANQTGISNDTALSLSQAATSSVGFLGVGLASSLNSSYTASTISNSVATSSITQMEKLNNLMQQQDTSDCTIESVGDVSIGNMSTMSLSGSQIGTTTTTTDITNKVAESVTQSASATVSGMSFSFIVVIVVVIVAMIAFAVVKKKNTNVEGAEGVQGGAVKLSIVWNTIGCLLIAGGFFGIGYMNLTNKIPCNNDSQCQPQVWYENPSFGCSCSDHLTCGINEPVHTPLPGVGVPLLFIAPMNDTVGQLNASMYLRKMSIRSVCGFDAAQSQVNNAGYNILNYINMRNTATSSSKKVVKGIFDAIIEFVQLHCSVEGKDTDRVMIWDPAFNGDLNDPSTYLPPCSDEVVNVLLPLTPYYMSSSIVNQNCVTAADSSGDFPSSCKTLEKPQPVKLSNKRPTLLERLRKVFKRKVPLINLNETPEPKPVNAIGAVNVSQRLCYDDSSSEEILYKRKLPGESCESLYGNSYKEMWSANSMHDMTLCKTGYSGSGAPTSDDDAHNQVKDQGGAFLNRNYAGSGEFSGRSYLPTQCNAAFAYLPRGETDCKKFGSSWSKIDSPDGANVIPNCDFTETINIESFSAGTFGGDGAANNGPYRAVVGSGWWPGNIGWSDDFYSYAQDGWVKFDDYQNNTNADNSWSSWRAFSNYNTLYESGNVHSRLALRTDMLSDAQTDKPLDINACSSESGSNDTNQYDNKNVASYRVGVSNVNGDVKVGTFCQTFGDVSGVNDTITGTKGMTRFVALAPDSLSFSITGDDTGNTDVSFSDKTIGAKNGDNFCRMASGFSARAGKYPYMNQIKINGNYKFQNLKDIASDATASAGSSAHEAQEFNKFFALNSGPIDPIGNCRINYMDDSNIKTCSASSLDACWNPELCLAFGGRWKTIKNGVNEDICSDGHDLNYSSTGIDCYPGKCVSTNDNCAVDKCDACLTKDKCPTSDGLCKWDGNSCLPGCNAENMRCDSCTEEQFCTEPCFWDKQSNVCRYGAPECRGSDNTGCCDETTYYVVKIPEAFCSKGAPANESDTSYNCSPGVFEVELTGTAKGFDETAQTNDASIQTCKAQAAPFETAFNIDCRKEGSNCYSTTENQTCPANDFQYLKIKGKAECFFDKSKGSVHFTQTSQDPSLYLAQSNTAEQQSWEAANIDNEDGQTLWYLCNRVFSWAMILSQTAAHQAVLTSTLGLSTLMNDAGMNSTDNTPNLKLESVQDIAAQLASPGGNGWAKVQPLLFILDSGDMHFATLEDIYKGKANKWWKDHYLKQINQFVYDKNATNSQFPMTVNKFALNGLGNAATSIDDAISEMKNYYGTLVGSTGFCQNLYSNDVVTYGCFGVAGVVVVVLVTLWILEFKKFKK